MLWCVILSPKGANNSVDLFVVSCVNMPWLGFEACVCMVVCGQSASQTMAGVRTPVRQLCTHQQRPDRFVCAYTFTRREVSDHFQVPTVCTLLLKVFTRSVGCTDLRARDNWRKLNHKVHVSSCGFPFLSWWSV